MPVIRRLDRLSADDVRILRLEHGPVAGHTTKLLIVSDDPADPHPLSVDAVRQAVGERLPRAPRCAQRLEVLPRGLGRPVWVPDSDFAIARHVRSATGVEAPLDAGGLRRLVARLVTERIDRRHPLWTVDVAPLTGGRTAIIWRIHHCMADGMTALRMGRQLIWDEVSPGRSDHGAAAASAGDRAATATRQQLIASAAVDRVRGTVHAVRQTARLASMAPHWRSALTEIAVLPGAIRRELAPTLEPMPLDGRITTRRAVAWASIPLANLHDAAKSIDPGVTLNDALVALVVAGVAAWSRSAGRHGRTLRVRIPVSLHQPDEPADAGGNRDSFIDVDASLGRATIQERLLDISRQTSERKRAHDAEHLDLLFRDIGALPFGAHALAMTAGPHEFALCVSNVPGPASDLRVLGRRVDNLYSIVEIAPHHALRVSVLSAARMLGIGLCADPEIVDVDEILGAIEREASVLLTQG